MNTTPALEFQRIGKSFSGVRVLRDVSFDLPPGHTLGLVGENGAGKSTLMNILGGNLRADTGKMLLGGQPYQPRQATDAARLGIAFIHQELNLFANLSIGENLYLTSFPRVGRLPWIDRSAVSREASKWLGEVGLHLPPDTPLDRLSAGERQLVEIAKALSVEARVIILDEPTTSLSARESETLFSLMQRLRSRRISMIYISHALGDVLRLCDEIVVLRDGEMVGAGPRAEFDINRMVTLMVGRALNQLFPARKAKPSPEVILEASDLTQPGILHKVSFRLRRGEVLGVSGLMGAGRSELARILFGLDPVERGQVLLNGTVVTQADVRERIGRGMAFLTENRREEGLCLPAGIADNMTLAALPRFIHPLIGWLKLPQLKEAVGSMRQSVRLTASAGDHQPTCQLSGGNQQKVVLAKWLLARPSVLVLDEPTRGIDIGAKFEIYQLIDQLAERGAGILVISSELDELIGICDRILVMSRGEIKDELTRPEFDRERVLRAALGT